MRETSATLACSAARISGSEISPKTCTTEESAAWARVRAGARVRARARVRPPPWAPHLEVQVDGPVRRGGAGRLVGAAQEDAHAGGVHDLLLRRLLRQRRLVRAVVDLDVHAFRRRVARTSTSLERLVHLLERIGSRRLRGSEDGRRRASGQRRLLSRGRLLNLVTPALALALLLLTAGGCRRCGRSRVSFERRQEGLGRRSRVSISRWLRVPHRSRRDHARVAIVGTRGDAMEGNPADAHADSFLLA